MQLFGRLAVVETHILWYFGHHCCLIVGFDALGIWHFWMFTLFHPFLPFSTHFLPISTTSRGCCLNRARTVRPFAYSVSTRSSMPQSELPWLVAGLPVYYHRSNGDRVSAAVVGPSPRGGRRVSIRYKLGGEEVLYEHAPEERLEFAIVTAESPDYPNLCTMRRRQHMLVLISGPWVCFYGGHSTGYKLGNHPKNIEPCTHCATTPPMALCDWIRDSQRASDHAQ